MDRGAVLRVDGPLLQQLSHPRQAQARRWMAGADAVANTLHDKTAAVLAMQPPHQSRYVGGHAAWHHIAEEYGAAALLQANPKRAWEYASVG